MTETPPVPDEFDSEEELKDYIDQLHDQIEFLEEELEDAEMQNLEEEVNEVRDNVEELETIEDYLDYNAENDLGQIDAIINRFQDRLDEVDTSNRGGISDSNPVAETVSDITGNDYGK
jgi:predicted nuclease with TOPRIM domain